MLSRHPYRATLFLDNPVELSHVGLQCGSPRVRPVTYLTLALLYTVVYRVDVQSETAVPAGTPVGCPTYPTAHRPF